MFEPHYSAEDHALEIILLALGFLALILVFFMVILTTAKLRRSSDAELGTHTTGWGGWKDPTDMAFSETYCDEPYFETVHRYSNSFVKDVRSGLCRLGDVIAPPKESGDISPVGSFVSGTLRRLSLQSNESRPLKQYLSCDQTAEDDGLSISATATGRDGLVGDSRRRSGNDLESTLDVDIEAQAHDSD